MVKTTAFLGALAGLLAACGGAPEASRQVAAAAPAEAALTAAEAAPEPKHCEVVLTPKDPTLEAETVAAAARWSQATGCDIHVGEGGVPIWLMPEIPYEDRFVPGLTGYYEDGRLWIAVTPERQAVVIPHEIGHVLHPHVGHVEDELPLEARQSLMSSGGGAGHITAADLEDVCSELACTAFVPEV